MPAACERLVKTENEKCTETILLKTSVCEPKAFKHTNGKTMTGKPLTSHTRSQLQNKRLRGPPANHDTEQYEVEEGSPKASDNPEYHPPPCDEMEIDGGPHFGDKNQPPRKRRKPRCASAKAELQTQEIVPHESAGLDQVLQLIPTALDDTYNIREPINVVFDK